MSKYPSVITPEILDQNKHISDDVIRQDISETLAEITIEKAKAESNETILNNSTDQIQRRMASFRMDAARGGVRRRQEFVDFLNLLLDERQPNSA